MTAPDPHVRDQAASDPEAALEALVSAAGGSARPLLRLIESEKDLVHRIHDEGRAAWGDLGLGVEEGARGLARVMAASWKAEREAARDPAHVPDLGRMGALLVAPDLYLAEALVQGRTLAWTRFERVIDDAYRAVRGHLANRTNRHLLEDIRESVLGTFFIDRKVVTYRATAPIGAWARQVIFNLFRQKMNQLRSPRTAILMSQIGEDEGEESGLLPASREVAPPEALVQAEWDDALSRIIPELLAGLDPDERRMLEVLPSRSMTQVQLCREMGISPFKLNRWYKELRARFLREVAQRLRWLLGVEADEIDALMSYLGELCGSRSAAAEGPDLTQDPPSAPSSSWTEAPSPGGAPLTDSVLEGDSPGPRAPRTRENRS